MLAEHRNNCRPHSTLAYMTPVKFATKRRTRKLYVSLINGGTTNGVQDNEVTLETQMLIDLVKKK